MEVGELRARAWAGIAAQQRLFGEHVPGARVVQGAGWTGSLVPSAADSALLNVAVPDEPETVLDPHELAPVFEPHGVRWGMWLDGTRADARRLRHHKMQTVSVCRVMARALTHVPAYDANLADATADLKWVGALNDRAYGLTDKRLETHFGLIASPAVHAHRVGRRATAAALDHDGDASLFFVATAPNHRRKGYATAAVKAAMAAAAQRGCATASLLATAEGAGLYARLGFEDLGPAQLWATR
jgi:ribosomal protein S18 acetylase RimI-like enzyme